MSDREHQLAELLWQAAATGEPIAPLRDTAAMLGLETSAENAYAVQRIVRDRSLRVGERLIGRKIGLTSKAVQQQLGVDSPDFGQLWASTSYGDGDSVQLATLIQPRIEAEVALVLGRDVSSRDATVADVIRATAFALPALEIVDSRVAQWKIALFDTIADNASAGAFVLGADPVKLHDVALRDAKMAMSRNGAVASEGIGSACLGHPLNAAAWLARALARLGEPLREGDIVLTGALGPMVSARAGDRFEARIEGLGAVSVSFC